MQTVPQANCHLAQGVGTGRIRDLPHWRNLISQDHLIFAWMKLLQSVQYFFQGLAAASALLGAPSMEI